MLHEGILFFYVTHALTLHHICEKVQSANHGLHYRVSLLKAMNDGASVPSEQFLNSTLVSMVNCMSPGVIMLNKYLRIICILHYDTPEKI